MKYRFLSILLLTLIFSCSNSDDGRVKNPYLPDYGFDTLGQINMSLPEYNGLQFPGGSVVIHGFSINGFVIYHINGDQYTCFEITDPNHNVNSCSALTVNGIFATCGCADENTYDIVTGLPADGTEGEYALKAYRIEVNGNILRVYN
ncbi:MAG: hypothetical protein R2802_07020 [Flavobacteriaceae bacterium]|nr:hypothetical protein [Mangrovimonas sp.]MCB0438717.1 hypothetical protein [Mangrovimonas sp.]HPF95950.1 hypothetical protein [Mangrovimonas sp.]